jgi:hypothetical protein
MTEQHHVSGGRTAPSVTSAQGRTLAVVGLGLALVGMMGGGTIANALFFVTIDAASFGSTTSAVVQGLSPIVMGVAAALSGWFATWSTDDLAVPLGRAAMVLGALALVGGIAVTVAGS